MPTEVCELRCYSNVDNFVSDRWRSTSQEAYIRCNVCGYQYKTKKTLISNLLSEPRGILFLSILLSLFLISISGLIITSVLSVYGYDIILKLCSAMEIPIIWRLCPFLNMSLSSAFWNLSFGLLFSSDDEIFHSQIRVLCAVSGHIEIGIIGLMAMGSIGFLYGILQESQLLRDIRNFGTSFFAYV